MNDYFNNFKCWDRQACANSSDPDQMLHNATHRAAITIEKFITKTSLFKYTENFTTKKLKISDKKYFYSKHRLWVFVRTASMRQF